MTTFKTQLPRRLIFIGFALLALSNVIDFSRVLNQGFYFEPGYRWRTQVFLEMLGPIFEAGGWWFLSRLQVKDSVQASLVAKAYFALGLGFSASCVAQLLQAGSAIFTISYIGQVGVATLGFGVGAVGFFMTSRAVAKVDFATDDS